VLNHIIIALTTTVPGRLLYQSIQDIFLLNPSCSASKYTHADISFLFALSTFLLQHTVLTNKSSILVIVFQANHPDFEPQHVVGDLTYITPSNSFERFQPKSKTVIPLVLEYWSVQETDNMPRWFVVDDR